LVSRPLEVGMVSRPEFCGLGLDTCGLGLEGSVSAVFKTNEQFVSMYNYNSFF